MRLTRIIFGILLAPAVVVLLYSALPDAPHVGIAFIEVYPVIFVLWLVTFLYCNYRGWLKLSQIYLAGEISGLLAGFLIIIFMALVGHLRHGEFFMALGIFTIGPLIGGAILAVSFWVIALSGYHRFSPR